MEIRSLEVFDDWLNDLRDRGARARIIIRIRRLANGNPGGDHQSVGEGVEEMRLHFGPGYRVYYIQRRSVLVVLLCGGDKSTQAKDISRAKALALQIEDD
jgi:putative addiction module killer protein